MLDKNIRKREGEMCLKYEHIISQMSLEEKASMMYGENT